MVHYITRGAFSLLTAIIFLVGCAESKTSAEEETEIKRMDSASRAVEDSTRRLEDQTRKVEERLEELNKEFESDKQND